jgi:L-threonylcarbamoyladenylate synthase
MALALVVDPRDPDPAAIAHAAAVLRGGGLVAFPTETVYGLGADALAPAAVAKIYAAKGRPAFNPLIVHVPDVAAARALVTHWPPEAERLAAAFWPGPLTLVLPKQPHVPDAVTAGGPTVAVRVPSHPVALALLRAVARPIAAPSANRSSEVSPTTAAHVVAGLGDRVDLVLDGGPCAVGIESAVVDLSLPRPRLLRPGTIDPVRLAACAGEWASAAPEPTGDAPRPAPGMIDRHYAPRARLAPYDPRDGAARAAVVAEAARRHAAGERLAEIVFGDPPLGCGERIAFSPDDPEAAARRLYAELHAADARGIAWIAVAAPPSGSAWSGVADRLRRAAHQ